jgi:hypothetical protein
MLIKKRLKEKNVLFESEATTKSSILKESVKGLIPILPIVTFRFSASAIFFSAIGLIMNGRIKVIKSSRKMIIDVEIMISFLNF